MSGTHFFLNTNRTVRPGSVSDGVDQSGQFPGHFFIALHVINGVLIERPGKSSELVIDEPRVCQSILPVLPFQLPKARGGCDPENKYAD